MKDEFYCQGCRRHHPAEEFHKHTSRMHRYCKRAWEARMMGRALAEKRRALMAGK